MEKEQKKPVQFDSKALAEMSTSDLVQLTNQITLMLMASSEQIKLVQNELLHRSGAIAYAQWASFLKDSLRKEQFDAFVEFIKTCDVVAFHEACVHRAGASASTIKGG